MPEARNDVAAAFDASVEAADWIGPEQAALVAVGRRLAAALDEVPGVEYTALSRLSLELRNVSRQLGLTIDQAPAPHVAGEISPLKTIRDSG